MKKSEYDFKILPDEAYKDDLSYAEKEQADGMLTTAVFGPERKAVFFTTGPQSDIL